MELWHAAAVQKAKSIDADQNVQMRRLVCVFAARSLSRRFVSIFGGCNQVRLKPVCSATETSSDIKNWHTETLSVMLSKRRLKRRWPDCANAQAGLLFVARIQQSLSQRGTLRYL